MLKATAVLAMLATPAAFAQMAVSVQSGLIHHYEGDVQLQGQPLKKEYGKFSMVKEGQTFNTTQGRAEVLLTPGVFLRLNGNSSIRMLSSALSNTRVELLAGSAMLEVAEIGKEHKVGMKVADSETDLLKMGLYDFSVEPGRVRVYEGKAQVSMKDGVLGLTKGKEVMLVSGLTAGKFNVKNAEDLYHWTQMRSAMIAQANISTASAARNSGYRMQSSMWAFYPGMGICTFLPRSGYIRSPFGWSYYSPGAVWQYYQPRYENTTSSGGWGGGDASSRGGWSGVSNSAGNSGVSSSSGYSGDTGARASAPASAPAVSAPSGGRGR
jgi:hypothetical protein